MADPEHAEEIRLSSRHGKTNVILKVELKEVAEEKMVLASTLPEGWWDNIVILTQHFRDLLAACLLLPGADVTEAVLTEF